MTMVFSYQPDFPLSADETEYELVSKDFVSTIQVGEREILSVSKEGLTWLARHAFHAASFYLRPAHMQQVASILDDPEASDNDRYVALQLLRNAAIAAEEELPLCQDTGTSTIIAEKGQQVWVDGNEREALSEGVFHAFQENNLRYSQNAALDMYTEVNTQTNLPALIDISAVMGNEYRFMFMNKGGGSSNKAALFQETKSILNPTSLKRFLAEKMITLGSSACPPYHIAFVVGGLSPEQALKTAKLASTKYYDALPTEGNQYGQAFRDHALEAELLKVAQEIGIGAQFGGKYFAHDIRVIRLPRHGGSCPIAMALSCSADRQVKAKINKDGIWMEKLERNPARYLLSRHDMNAGAEVVHLDLTRPFNETLETLSRLPVSTRLSLTGPIIVARDIAHARIKEKLDKGEPMPNYLTNHVVYYAGPAKTPANHICGALGPTTGGRMDCYTEEFQSVGGSLVMLTKGNRSQQVTDACKKYGGFSLGSVGGAAALLAKEYVMSLECLEYPELGMEAIYMMEVKDMPAFIMVDDKGNNFYQFVDQPSCHACIKNL
ncbi:FumA C-terminus/TtdB family hydratase beta subunit [Yokenella regensburgei]|uniref:FumA C-terminus/TtdB family hydratase beta subunit n=1 Tax=Yokenella regensburgei TaxID=158877 RepID=UPI0031DDAA60